MAVHTVLVSSGEAATAGKADAKPVSESGKTIGGGKATGAGKTDVVRVASRDLVYSDETKKAEFTGGVAVESRDGIMRAQQVVVYLQPAQKTNGATEGSCRVCVRWKRIDGRQRGADGGDWPH